MRKIAITSGDPAGIGGEIIAKALKFFPLPQDCIFIIYGSFPYWNFGNEIVQISSVEQAIDSKKIYHIPIENKEIILGQPSKYSGEIAYYILEKVSQDLNKSLLDAVITCPISKSKIRESIPDFIGHTEFFAEKSNSQNVVMSFYSKVFSLSLLTTHISIEDVCQQLNEAYFKEKIRLIYKEAIQTSSKPKIAILAVNPHGGEEGAFGNIDEKIKIYLQDLQKENIFIDGPFPADTFFAYKLKDYKHIISAYHDQGLIPFKMLSKGSGVNVSLGLPYIRVSVDHGTAFDIATQNIADKGSFLAAMEYVLNKLQISTPSPNAYSVFANFYDEYMSHVNYTHWVNLVLDLYKRAKNSYPQKILELACGTANISCELVKKGYDVYASDLSPQMLSLASEKKYAPKLFWANMCDKIKYANFDLVLNLFDSFNYLLSKDEIRQMLKNVYLCLNEKGIFIFDVTTMNNCLTYFNGFVNYEETDRKTFIHTSELNKDLQTTNLNFFLKDNLFYKNYKETHQQRIYNTDVLQNLIKNSGFTLLGIFANNGQAMNFQDYNMDFQEKRLFYILKRINTGEKK